MKFTRRQSLQLGAATLATHVLPGCYARETAESRPRGAIDSHVHIWTDDFENYPLQPWATKADMVPATYTDQELLAEVHPFGVNRVVLIQHAPLHGYDNSYILDCAKARPGTFSIVAMINERTLHLKERLRNLRDQGARGIRIGPKNHADRTLNVDPPNWLKAPGMQLLWQHAAELGVSICPLVGPQFLPSIDAMCEQYPDTTVVVDHFGNIKIDDASHVKWLTALARHPNLYLKVSAFHGIGDKQPPYDDVAPQMRLVIDVFGPERLMWGSNCPYQTMGENNYADAIGLLRNGLTDLSDSEREMILSGTAEKVFF